MDALVFHFLKFRQEKRVLPVLWHQCFLAFVEIYAADISCEQKEALLGQDQQIFFPRLKSYFTLRLSEEKGECGWVYASDVIVKEISKVNFRKNDKNLH